MDAYRAIEYASNGGGLLVPPKTRKLNLFGRELNLGTATTPIPHHEEVLAVDMIVWIVSPSLSLLHNHAHPANI